MPIILAIETSADLASAAVLHNGRIVTRETAGVQTHSQTILPMVQQVLAETGIALSACDAIAFGAGPGSFTGVRTACGVAQGLAFGADLPVVAVCTLQAMAEACHARCGADDVLALLDARMDEVYWARYRFDDGWHVLSQPTLSRPEGIPASEPAVACGNALAVYASALTVFAERACTGIVPHARQIALLGATAFASGQAVDARDAQPVYLRNKVALTTSERLAKVAA